MERCFRSQADGILSDYLDPFPRRGSSGISLFFPFLFPSDQRPEYLGKARPFVDLMIKMDNPTQGTLGTLAGQNIITLAAGIAMVSSMSSRES